MTYDNLEHYFEEHDPPEKHDTFEEWYNSVNSSFVRSGNHFPPQFIEDMRKWWNNSGVDQQDKVRRDEIAELGYEVSARNVPTIRHMSAKKYRHQVRQYNKNKRFFSPYLSQRMKKKIDSKYHVDEETKRYKSQRTTEYRLLRKLRKQNKRKMKKQ